MTDAIVSPEGIRDAENVVGQMDSDAAIAWLRPFEDTLAMWVHRQSLATLDHLRTQHRVNLSDVAKSVIIRAIVQTGVTAIAALQAAHHTQWLDLVGGTQLSTIDPLLSVRRRLVHQEDKKQNKNRQTETNAAEGGLRDPKVTKFAFVSCMPAVQAFKNDRVDALLLLSAGPKRTLRHELIDLETGQRLLHALIDSLADVGCETARTAQVAIVNHPRKAPPQPPQRKENDLPPDDNGGIKA